MSNPNRTTLWAIGVGLLAVTFSVWSFTFGRGSNQETATGSVNTAPLSTPAGITLQPLGKAQGADLGKQTAARLPRDEVAYTDARGMTLYTFDQDPPGQSACVDECTKTWLPALAPADVEVFGDWSVIKRPEGSTQWAYKQKPLYTYVLDVDPGSVAGNSPLITGARRMNGAGVMVGGGVRGGGIGPIEKNKLPAGWHPALLYPVSDVAMPPGIAMKEVLDAAMLALVDHRRHTLYSFNGSEREALTAEGKSDGAWAPVRAPRLAEKTGEFTLIERGDGIRQWAYRGKGLYTYSGDLAPGDANGDRTPGWSVAAVVRHYMPPSVMISQTPGLGRMLATIEGKTLYKRDGYIHQSGGGYSLRRGAPTRPAVGRDIGLNARCDAECQKVWHPYLAPADARPQGYWDVAVRDDGSKQWVYQGFALYTFDGDKQPGDINGNDRYDFVLSHDPSIRVEVGTPMDAAAALYWGIMAP